MLYTAGLRMVLLVHVLPSSQMNTMMILKELVESGTYSPARLLKVPISGMRTQITPDRHKWAQCLSYPPKSEVKYYNTSPTVTGIEADMLNSTILPAVNVLKNLMCQYFSAIFRVFTYHNLEISAVMLSRGEIEYPRL